MTSRETSGAKLHRLWNLFSCNIFIAMERWKATLLFLILVSTAHRVSSNSCEESSYERCLKGLMEFSHRPHFLFGNDEDELQRECLTAQSKLDCLYRHTRRCLPPDGRDEFLQKNVAQSEEVIAAMCDESSKLRTEYLRILPCLQNASEGLLYCKQKYDFNERDINISGYENEFHLRCCSQLGYSNCVILRMQSHENCGPDTVYYANEMTLAIAGKKFLEECDDEFELCVSSNTDFIRPFFITSGLMFVTSLLISQFSLTF